MSRRVGLEGFASVFELAGGRNAIRVGIRFRPRNGPGILSWHTRHFRRCHNRPVRLHAVTVAVDAGAMDLRKWQLAKLYAFRDCCHAVPTANRELTSHRRTWPDCSY